MRNLVLLCQENYPTGCNAIKSMKIDSKCSGICYGVGEKEVFRIHWREKRMEQLFACEDVLDVEYLMLSGELCVAKTSGEILLWNFDTNTFDEVAFCGDIITAMAWSPDQEMVVFATESNRIIVMHSLFDIIEEVDLLENSFGDKEFVVLGWGKKETQFHGSAGKKAAQKKEITDLPGDFSPSDDSGVATVNVAWRGDGEYFVVNFLKDNQRLFKVFNREGKLQYTSEKCIGLESCIAWKPSGLWIAVSHNLEDKYVITLFEKNGLRHRELCLPFKREEESVKSLKWSSDSVVLAIHTLKETSSNIYLYTLGNYHWYLKQTLQFHDVVQHFDWDSSLYEWKSLHVLLADGSYNVFKWNDDINCSVGQTVQDESIVGVIDGQNVLLTNFRGVVVPPPLCVFTLKSKNYVNSVGFIQHPKNPRDSNKFFSITNQHVMSFYECEFSEGQSSVRHIKGCKEVENFDLVEKFSCYNLTHWLTDGVLIIETFKKDLGSYLNILMKNEDNQWCITDEVSIKTHAISITSSDSISLVVNLLDKTVLKKKVIDGKFVEGEEHFSLPEFCEKTISVKIASEEKTFSLRGRQMLYMNGDKFQQDVTSFFIAQPFLAYTTIDELKIINLMNMNVDTVRKTERGAKIVTIVPKHDRTILQMPRGNLETIQPRALTLNIVGELLDGNEYRKAYEILRKQRINLNLIVDHNPKEFFSNLDVFLEEITNPSWLNLFLTDLKCEDVTTTIYEGSYRMKTKECPEDYSIEEKVEKICEEMCEKMESMNEKRFTLPIITSFVKRNDIESALTVIWNIRTRESQSLCDFSESEDALNYLLYLVDVNQLYDIALGMYDFKLVLFVAEKSQKDPKEYISYLKDLNKLEEFYKRYKIDLHLKKYGKALENIAKCEGHFEECMKLVKEQHLHPKAMQLFPQESSEYKEIAQAYADNLRFKGLLEEASLMYERAGNLEEAIQTAKNTLDFNRCLTLKKKSGATEEELTKLVSSLIPSMKENCMFREAADLMKQYMRNSTQVIETLLEGKLYMAAVYEWHEVQPSDYSLDYMRAHLQKYAEVLMDCMRNDKSQFVSYKMRLATVRQKRLEQPDDPDLNYFDDCDLYSDVTSANSSRITGSSRGSSKTFKSGKSRRKHKRKLLSLKEGNPFEDVALIDALFNLISKCFSQQQHVKEICRASVLLNIDETGKTLQHCYKNLLYTIQLSLDEIWIPNDTRLEIVEPHKRLKPYLSLMNWEFEIFK
ncbi:elongator complex protein 1 [Phlebotomus argentipes]|uniref:elongator complex protein 1 n=1 Tax=Phlebotomus argentipes TaxID=94469 RepID=UPI00289374F0|nr:elongator complex protein 1 [Phlebotomus argentipes]